MENPHPPKLDYQSPSPASGASGAIDLAFWIVYFGSTWLGLWLFNVALHTWLKGRPGDSGMACCFIAGIILSTIFLACIYPLLKRRVGWRLVLAPLMGILAPGPGFLVAVAASG